MVRYPEICVTRRTPNALLLVAMVRHELRRAGVAAEEIRRFSTEALQGGAERAREVCSRWVSTPRRLA